LTASNSTRERLALSTMLLVGRDFDKPDHGWRLEGIASQLRVPRHLLEPVAGALADAGLLTRTAEKRLIPARDLRRIAVVDILAAIRSGERDTHHQSDDEWNPTVAAVADDVESAIRSTIGEQTLADLVDADAVARAAAPQD
jgi:DNA-binding IscR family transcriptional regulator